MKYKLLKGAKSRDEGGERVIYKTGDTIDLTPSQARKMAAGSISPVAGEGTKEEKESMDWSFVQSQTVPEVLEVVKGLDDTDSLSALLESEKLGANRIGVRKGVEERIKELS